jgi:hypothetical protein
MKLSAVPARQNSQVLRNFSLKRFGPIAFRAQDEKHPRAWIELTPRPETKKGLHFCKPF